MTSFQNSIATYRPRGTAPQRTVGLILTAVLNAGIIYALLAELGMVPMPIIPKPIDGRVIIEPDDRQLPPPPQPTIPAPRITEFVPPIIEIPVVPEDDRNTITPPQVQPATPPAEPPQVASLNPPATPPLIVSPARAIMATHTIPDYPPVSRRLGEQGMLRLRLAIGADGAVQDARVETSSGYRRLDDAAIQWVKAHWRYEPAMQGPKAIPSTATAEVTFRLR
jgi:protein TonB